MPEPTPGRERPILFSGPMIRAILAGTKTQTRRLIQPRHLSGTGFSMPTLAHAETLTECIGKFCPYGVPGDRLWVRETWAAVHFSAEYAEGFPTGYCDDWHGSETIPTSDENGYWSAQYAADEQHERHFDDRGWHWRPSIHMPRWASRLTLEILAVRVHRLQDITINDIKAEGIAPCDPYRTWKDNFARLWDGINGKRASWASNPWVWALNFRTVKGGAA